MPRTSRGPGVSVDPARVREARIAAGLTLAALAGEDVSRTMVHLVEQGRSRPSKAVLQLIAHRTRMPIAYFLNTDQNGFQSGKELAAELSGTAARLRRFIATKRLAKLEREAMKLVEVSLRHGASLARTLEINAVRGSNTKPPN